MAGLIFRKLRRCTFDKFGNPLFAVVAIIPKLHSSAVLARTRRVRIAVVKVVALARVVSIGQTTPCRVRTIVAAQTPTFSVRAAPLFGPTHYLDWLELGTTLLIRLDGSARVRLAHGALVAELSQLLFNAAPACSVRGVA
eukprot:329563-Pleurochrysis_carterae.AAC.5